MYGDDRETVKKEETFNLMRACGITKAIVEFSGGNDEGGPDGICVVRQGAIEESDLPLYYMRQGDTPSREEELADLLARPVYAEYGSFAGEFYVDGRVVWDLEKRTVRMTGAEQVSVSEELPGREW